MLTKDQHPFAELGRTPISSDSACGQAVKYEPSFEALEAELAKAESLSSETVDWSQVSSLASSILENESKDFLVASYLTHALLVIEGYQGLSVGFQILHDLANNYWEEAFPPVKRLRARESALNWLSEKAGSYIEEKPPADADAEHVVRSFELMSATQDILDQKMESSAPGMMELSRPLKNYKKSADALVKPADSAPAATPASTPQASPVAKEAPALAQNPETSNQAPAPSATPAQEGAEQAAPSLDHPLVELGAKAIPGDSPAGIAVKYEPSFEAIEAELAKQESVSAEVLDWSTVKRLGVEILEGQSKDLLVGSYLAHALFELEGYKGLAAGLKIIKDMMSEYWDPMFPPVKRMRARSSALNWLSEKAGERVQNVKPQGADNEGVLLAYGFLSDIQDICDEKIEEGAPSFLELSRPLKELKRAAEAESKPKAAPAPVPAPTPQAPAAASPEPAAPAPAAKPITKPKAGSGGTSVEAGPVANENEAKRVLRQIQDAGRKVGDYLLGAKTSDPRPYRLNRIASWIMIEAVPPLTNGASQLPPPPADKRKQFVELFEAAKFAELLPSLEQSLARAPFWIDGHRMSAIALDGLGADHQEAKETVIREVRNFLSRVDGVSDAAFNDGTPFADEATKAWIADEVMVDSSADAGDGAGQGSAPWSEALAEAKPLMAKGKIKEAAQGFQEAMHTVTGGLNRIRWKLALVELLKQGGRDDITVPLLESLMQESADQNIDSVEPSVSAQIYKHAYETYLALGKKNKNDPELLQKAENVYIQLFKVDPFIAIKLKEKKNG